MDQAVRIQPDQPLNIRLGIRTPFSPGSKALGAVEFISVFDDTVDPDLTIRRIVIAACGLIELSKAVGGRDGKVYLNAALRLLKTLDEQRVSWDPETDYLLEKCTAAYHDEKHEFSIIYGDYYFLEAILKLTGKELFIW